MSRRGYSSDTLWRLYQIGGADLALRYAEMSSESSSREPVGSELKISGLRFYTGGAQRPELSLRKYDSRFRKSDTRYIYAELELANPWRYVSMEYKILARFIRPDGSLMGESEGTTETNPEWETYYYSQGWGWDEPGNWSPGQYRVEIEIDHEPRLSGEFTIYDDLPDRPRSTFLKSNFDEDSPFKAEFDPNFFSKQKLDPDFFSQTKFDLDRFLRPKPEKSTHPPNLDQVPPAPDKIRPRLDPVFGSRLGENPLKPESEDDLKSKAGPLSLGFEGWMDRLFPESQGQGSGEEFDPSQPMDELKKMRWLMAIDRRYLAALPRTKIGLADEQVLKELEEIAADYQKLLEAGPSRYLFTSEAGLREKIADSRSSAAQVAEILRDYPRAQDHYLAAAEIYTATGKGDQARKVQASLARLKFAQEGNVDAEIRRLRSEIDALPESSLAHQEGLIELAGLYSSNGDDYEAEQLLVKAEALLDRHQGDPSGSKLADALSESLLSIMQQKHAGGPTPVEKMLKANELYRELYLGLARIYQAADPKKAAHYREKATQRDSRANNDAFSEQMRKALKGDLGKL
jgi:tetratricopeptide (TPR) repeat protein